MTNASTHVAIAGSQRTALPGAIATGRTNPNAKIEVTLKLRRKKEMPINGRPASALTRKDLGNMYGASQADIDKVIQTFGKFGLKPVKTSLLTRSVRLSGTIAAMEEAFQVKLFNYKHETNNYRGRVGSVLELVEFFTTFCSSRNNMLYCTL
jgi:kumamolisin